uniref:Pescadillo homolog n=1 Tax=Chrysotila carterae TaxID=13221 RepID=A0A7S4BWV3_CHRCT
MAKAGEAAKARADRKAHIKQKKKFKNRNAIGKARKNVGSAAKYITRTQAVKKLQVTLKDFRRLCILKGIYPREPKKKFKGGNTTYYFAKDVAFLAHEPLLDKFREQKAFLKKIRRAVGRHDKKIAMRLDARRPEYRLDHLIRERYPTFLDALHELDDALCLVHLFASIAPSQYVEASRVHNCNRLAREFQAYVTQTRSLRKVFVSIKGFYYQAEISGVTLTWIVPHAFAQQPSMQVDYRVMLSFLELYEALMTFVNFKLYHSLGLAYPPQIDAQRDDSGAFLSAMLLRSKAIDSGSVAAPVAAAPSSAKAPTQSQLQALKRKLEQVERDAAVEKPSDQVGGGAPDDDLAPMLDDSVPDEIATLRTLFKGCVFFCGRESPIASLELLVLACGGKLGWEGEASAFDAASASITHQVVDRPCAPSGLPPTREVVQPQWVYDCVNARSLLPTHAYRPGKLCPPHLSPFLDGSEGYTPKERLQAAIGEMATRDGEIDGEIDAEIDREIDGDDDEGEEEEEEEESEDEEEEIEDAEDEEEDDAPKTKKVKKTVSDWELINDAKALWTRNPADITEEEYKSFYQSLTKDFGEPLTHTHFSAEGEVEFKSILYIPKEAGHDVYNDYYKKQNNLKLYVRRVMITDEFDELLPKYLGFIKGVVDSDSLPLNVSREMLQQNKVLKVIGKKMTRKALAMIKSLADADKKDGDEEEEEEEGEESPKKDESEVDKEDGESKYDQFWKSFGKYIKMGLIEDAANRTRLAKLLRYATSKSGDKEISLEEYVANMKDDQKNIYYISGDDKDSLMKSPSVEKLLAKDIEIIFMTDAVDEYTVQHLTEFEGKRLINASREGLKLEEGDKEKKREELYKEMFKPFLDFAKETLGKKVEKVSISKHLVKSPVVVLSADYGWTAQMEKVMKSQAFADQSKFEFMKSKRMFEVNPRHPMIIELNNKIKEGASDDNTKDAVMSLYLSAVVSAGYQLTPEDAQDFSSRITRIVTSGLGVDADAELAPELDVPEDAEEEEEEEEEEESSTKEEL